MLSESELKLLDTEPSVSATLDIASQGDPERQARVHDVSQSMDMPEPVVQGELDELERRRRVQSVDTSTFGPELKSYLSDVNRATISIDDLDNLRDTEDGFFRRRWNDARRGGNQLLRSATTLQGVTSQSRLNAYNIVNQLSDVDISQAVKISSQMSTQQFGQYVRGDEGDRGRLRGRESKQSWRLPLYDFIDANPNIPFSEFSDPGLLQFIRSGEKQRKEMSERQATKVSKALPRFVKQTADIEKIPSGRRREAFDQAKSLGEAFGAFADAPLEVTTSLTTESLVQFSPALAALPFGLGAASLAAFTTSFENEYAGDIVGSLQDAGVDLSDEASIADALTNPEMLTEIKSHAQDRSVPIAMIDAISMGIAGRLTNLATTPKGRVAAGAGESLVLQPSLGGAGEAAGAVAAGDEIEGQAVLAEMLGEVAPGTIETAAGVYRARQDSKTAKKIKRIIDSAEDQSLIDEFITLSQSSKTNERSKELYREFLAKAGEDQVVFIPADIVAGLDEIPDYMAEQLDGLGADVEVSIDRFMSDIAVNPEILEALRPHLKMNEDLMTADELDQGMDIKAELEKAQTAVDEKTELDEIESTIYEQLKDTGRATDAEARASAKLYSARAATAAQRYGITPKEVFERMGVTIAGPSAQPEQAGPQESVILDQQDFGDLTLTETVQVEGSAKPVTVTQSAQRTFDQTVKRRNVISKLKDCLNAQG